jgi:hypothetical protein
MNGQHRAALILGHDFGEQRRSYGEANGRQRRAESEQHHLLAWRE